LRAGEVLILSLPYQLNNVKFVEDINLSTQVAEISRGSRNEIDWLKQIPSLRLQ